MHGYLEHPARVVSSPVPSLGTPVIERSVRPDGSFIVANGGLRVKIWRGKGQGGMNEKRSRDSRENRYEGRDAHPNHTHPAALQSQPNLVRGGTSFYTTTTLAAASPVRHPHTSESKVP